MLKIYIDASTKSSRGPSGVGLVVIGENRYDQLAFPLEGDFTNHEAEFMALITALKYIISENLTQETLMVYTDSKVVASVVEKNHTKNENFKPYLEQIQELLVFFHLFLLHWIPESQNKGADNLARQALNKKMKRKQ